MGRILREKNTVQKMIRIYCRNHHSPNENICEGCELLLKYSLQRLDRCQFGENKPSCSKCPIHCYSKSNRENIKMVMRFSGPKMIFRHPYLAVMHLVDQKRNPLNPSR